MTEIIIQILGPGAVEYGPQVAGALAVLLTVVFIDIIRDIFTGCFRG